MRVDIIIISSLVVILVASLSTLTPSYAITKLSDSHKIAVVLSQACINLEKNHIKSKCPSYYDLRPLEKYNPLIDGQWVNDTYYHKLPSKVKYAYQFQTKDFIVKIDPNSEFLASSRTIEILPDSFIYINPSDIVGNNHTRIEYHDRFVADCSEARIASFDNTRKTINLVQDTIKYLESGCKKTNFNDKTIIRMKEVPIEKNNQYSSIHYYDYLKSIYHKTITQFKQKGGNGLGDCRVIKCNYKDPYKKEGYD